jgi:hypothetical protein
MRTLSDARRLCALLVLADRRWRTLEEIVYLNEDYTFPSREIRRAILRSLEVRGLVRADRSRRPFRFQVVLPEEPWLKGLERWAEVEIGRREVSR